jgi:5S rRNA maturation endonuclease (ribonuclease M5)
MSTSAIDRVLAPLRERGEVKNRGQGWRCLCPAHPDTNPSLDVDYRDGRVLLICRSRDCSAAAIASALGLTLADLFDGALPERLSFEERIVRTYDYRDEQGELLFQTVRLWAPPPKNKDFRQRRPDGKGEWIWKLDGTRRVLYRLPELVAAGRQDCAGWVFVVEGEKDADRLANLGLVATTNPMGAGKWRNEYAQFLRGRRVVILPDNDEPGRKHAGAIAASLQGVAASVKTVELPNLPPKGDVSDWLNAAGTVEQLLALIQQPEQPVSEPAGCEGGEPGDKGGEGKKPKGPPAAEVLTSIGRGFDLWHDPAQVAYATDGRQSYAIRSKAFRLLLINEYRLLTDKVPNAEALGNALATIEAAAVYDGPEYPAHVRLAGHQGRVYLHLADSESTVIEIDGDGWRECPNPPVRFRKPAGMLPLPMPLRDGRLDDLKEFLNAPDDSGNFTLILAYLMGCFRPNGPFPVLVCCGEQGSAKTTTGRVLKRLIDPSSAPMRSEPKEPRDLMIQARNNWILAFDNLSYLRPWLSDAFCRLATGGGFATRELYTNDDEVIFDSKRPLVVNGIEDFVTRGDLLERSLLVRHPPIPEEKRRPESEFWAEFDLARPKLLGAVLDRVSVGLRALPSTNLSGLPRMADFALFAVACEGGKEDGSPFLIAYTENQSSAHEQALSESHIPAALVAMMEARQWQNWEGTPTELYVELGRFAPNPQPKDWPKKPNVLTNKLRRLAPNLRRVHRLDIHDDPGRSARGRWLCIARAADPTPSKPDPAKGGQTPSRPSRPSRSPENPAIARDDHGTVGTVAGRSRDGAGTIPVSAKNTGKTSIQDGRDGRDGVSRLFSDPVPVAVPIEQFTATSPDVAGTTDETGKGATEPLAELVEDEV